MEDAILNMIFNPESQNFFHLTEDTTYPEDGTTTAQINLPIESINRLKTLEKEAVLLAEESKFEESIHLLNECLLIWDTYASAYNNRGQAYRCLKQYGKAWEDIDKAIKFGKDQPLVLKQAYTQRAIMRKFDQCPLEYKESSDVKGSFACNTKNTQEKREALKDFEMGAKYGNPIAAHYAIQGNPYAAMCNDMLKTVMTQYKH